MHDINQELCTGNKYREFYYKGLLWIFSVYLNQDEPLMWTGWNLKGISDTSKGNQQQLWYLPQINSSLMSSTLVMEMLRRSIQIESEPKRRYISVINDLAIARIAYQIKATGSPTFDAVFINLGAFHIEMAYFNALGKYITESGGPFILNESGVLACGSLTGFIKGKHYNRWKCIHMLFSAALQILRLKQFVKLDEGNATIDCLRDEIVNIDKTPFDISDLLNDFKDFLDTYNNSAEATLKGLDGYTAPITNNNLVVLGKEISCFMSTA